VQRLEVVFTCLADIAELTVTLISAVEDTLEMTEPNQVPAAGICLLELAEVKSPFNFYCHRGLIQYRPVLLNTTAYVALFYPC
jgi:hypothetical protein